jgi:hypothetical protein
MALPATRVMAIDTLKTTTQLEYTGYGHDESRVFEIEFQLIFISLFFKNFIY